MIEPSFQTPEFKKLLKKEYIFTAVAISTAPLMFILLNEMFACIYILEPVKENMSNPEFAFSLDILLTLISMLLPFLLIGKLIKSHNFNCVKMNMTLPLSKPQGGAFDFLLVPAGVGFCMLSNVLTGYFVQAVSLFGIELSSPQLDYPDGAFGLLLSILRVGVVAAVCEEVAFRGVVLRALVPFGERFAIVCSAAIFGLLHGNLVQAPFGFIVGLALGWICLSTGSIWPSMLVHFLNNSISVCISYIPKLGIDENLQYVINTAILYILPALGLISAIAYRRKKGPFRVSKDPKLLSGKTKAAYLFLNPGMIIVIVYVIIVTAQFIKW